MSTEAEVKPKELTKKQLRILQKQQQQEQQAKKEAAQDPDKYGDSPLIQSQEITDKRWKHVSEITKSLDQQQFWVRGHLQNYRGKSKIGFLLIRQGPFTIQGVLSQDATIPKEMMKYASTIPKESVVDIFVTVTIPNMEIKSTSQKDVELQVHKLFTVSKSLPELPFQIEDASHPDSFFTAESAYVCVGLDTRLNERILDLRTATNQSILRIQSAVSQLFREYCYKKNFIEIHTPKLIGGSSEGGADCFKLKYFEKDAVLAQSPQLYKQMACACSGFERVFEIGPVFRAENSNTNRHLCEFTGLDFEMVIQEHYYEVLEFLSELFIYIFDNLKLRFSTELNLIQQQHPFSSLLYLPQTLRLTFEEGCALLKEKGYKQELLEDLSTENEKALGKIVREKYNTDFFILDKFPLSARPFYTMPHPTDKRWSNSFDVFIRGEEIISGAQRIHDVNLLKERITAMNIPLESVQSYCDSFKYGAKPHGGGGIGLERVVMLYLGLSNIRKASMFPRDPKRLAP